MFLKNIRFISGLLLLCTFLACDKNDLRLLQFDTIGDKAYVRFALYSPATPTVVIKVNDVKVNGALTGGNGGFFPAVSTTPDYSAIPPNGTFRLSLANSGTANDSILIFNGTLAADAGKFYSITLADTGADRTVFSIPDNLTALADSANFKIRLINAMAKTPALNLIRIDSSSATVVTRDTIARNISFKDATSFITTSISPLAIPGTSPVVKYATLRFRITTVGTGLLVGGVTAPAFNTLSQRSITIYAFGFGNGTGIYAPGLSGFIFNQ